MTTPSWATANLSKNSAHGFVWPDGLPSCKACGRLANDSIHVTPGRLNFGGIRSVAAVPSAGRKLPQQPHAYAMSSSITGLIPCVLCGATLEDSRHPIGVPSGMLNPYRGPLVMEPPNLAHEAAFVSEIGDKIVLASRQSQQIEPSERLIEEFRQKGGSNGPHMWLAGRYVQADQPNRNAAYWSTADLELGQPSVANGPINWLHEERHIIGAIVASQLVTRELASDEVGNHIMTIGALWPWVYPTETAMVAQASAAGTLWQSMECTSKEVACLADDCQTVMPYRAYMLEKASRCDHMKDGQPRRFVEPVFQGMGIIIPPVRPGWANAEARVLMPEATGYVESQAAAFEGMEASEAEGVVAQILAWAGERARDFSAGQRKKAASSGSAMKDGSFPIKNAGDLANAIKLAGHAKDPAAARKHIIKRAKALGLESKLPEGWL